MRTCAALGLALIGERQRAHVCAGWVGGAADEAAAAARQLDAQRLPACGARPRRLRALALLRTAFPNQIENLKFSCTSALSTEYTPKLLTVIWQ